MGAKWLLLFILTVLMVYNCESNSQRLSSTRVSKVVNSVVRRIGSTTVGNRRRTTPRPRVKHTTVPRRSLQKTTSSGVRKRKVTKPGLTTRRPTTTQSSIFVPPPYAPTRGTWNARSINANNRKLYTPYKYTTSDTGYGTLGSFLRFFLGKMKNPTYATTSHDDYAPKYDHYKVHHYYHKNNATVVQTKIISNNTIVGCTGDSDIFCPVKTRSVCTKNGIIRCVSKMKNTLKCDTTSTKKCLITTIPCIDRKEFGCDNNQNNRTIIMPCLSILKISGYIGYNKTTIVPRKYKVQKSTTDVTTNITTDNITNVNITTANITNANITTANITNANITNANITTANITTINTTPISTNITTLTTPTNTNKTKTVTNFCLTIIAVPAKRKQTKGEKAFDGFTKTVEKFFVKVWGI